MTVDEKSIPEAMRRATLSAAKALLTRACVKLLEASAMRLMDAAGVEPEGPWECWNCDAEMHEDSSTGLCPVCDAERERHPVWQAIQRVERGEVVVARHGDLDPGHFGNYQLKTSDGWVFEIFPDGVPFEEWDYIDSATGPDGVRWEPPHAEDDSSPYAMPGTVWMYRPQEPRRWALG